MQLSIFAVQTHSCALLSADKETQQAREEKREKERVPPVLVVNDRSRGASSEFPLLRTFVLAPAIPLSKTFSSSRLLLPGFGLISIVQRGEE